jgi:phosphatidate cytidylyltransferase
MRRILTAAVLAALVLVVIKVAPPAVCIAVFVAFGSLGVHEAFRMAGRAGRRPFAVFGTLAAAAIAWSFGDLPPAASPMTVLVGFVVVTLIASLWLRDDPEAMHETAVSTLFPVAAIALPLSYMVAMRSVPGPDGEDLPLLMIVAATFGDTAAFYVGSTFGRHRMAPRISPKKSWEGAAGGLAGSVAGVLLASGWFYRGLPLPHALALGVLLGAFGILGDLSESMMKRALGAKDASRALPGHGGFLDRLDSLILGAPVLYGYWYLFLRGPH